MIDALICGRVFGKPQSRVTKAGHSFATAKVRASMANGELSFVNVAAFSDTAKAALLALNDGDSVALTGELKVGVYIDKRGDSRPSLDLTAFAVLTEYHVSRKRKAMAPEGEPTAALVDDAPF